MGGCSPGSAGPRCGPATAPTPSIWVTLWACPEIAKTTLRAKTSTDPLGEVWHQDPCRHFGGWPNLTDAIVGAIGAWSTYLASGDEEFLRWSYQVTRNSLARAERDAFDAEIGVVPGLLQLHGVQQRLPFPLPPQRRAGRAHQGAEHQPALPPRLHARRDGWPRSWETIAEPLTAKALKLREAINHRLWVPGKANYAYYENEHGHPSSRTEGLGVALAVLWGVADDEKAEAVLKNTHITGHGIPCLWPRYLAWLWHFNDANYYHNGMVWPFVQAYWAQAAAVTPATPRSSVPNSRIWPAWPGGPPPSTSSTGPSPASPTARRASCGAPRATCRWCTMACSGCRSAPSGIAFRPLVPSIFNAVSLGGFRYREMELDLGNLGLRRRNRVVRARWTAPGTGHDSARSGRQAHRVDHHARLNSGCDLDRHLRLAIQGLAGPLLSARAAAAALAGALRRELRDGRGEQRLLPAARKAHLRTVA